MQVVVEGLEKVGYIIILSVFWLICCIPVITIGPATAALYYSIVKSLRRGRGYPIKEFFAAFKRSLLKGIVLTLIFGICSFSCYLGSRQSGVYTGILLLDAMILAYIFPVLSRFNMKILEIIKLSFIMAVRFIYLTVPLLLVYILAIYAQYRILPIWTIIILPGLLAYISSFALEIAMRKYIKVTKDNEDEWYIF